METRIITTPFNTTPTPISLKFHSISGEVIGEFKEVDNKLVFIGDVDDSANVFIDLVLKSFEQRVLWLTEQRS